MAIGEKLEAKTDREPEAGQIKMGSLSRSPNTPFTPANFDVNIPHLLPTMSAVLTITLPREY